jgi:hypothetical protein
LRTTGNGTVALVKSGAYCLVWALLGPILMIYIIAMDLANFFHILSQHEGFTRTKEEKIAANKADDTLKI